MFKYVIKPFKLSITSSICKFSIKPLSQSQWEIRIERVKAIKFQAPKIRNILLQLPKCCEDPNLKSDAMCITTYEIENFEFVLGTNIWYDILFAINFVSKILQLKDMHIDVARSFKRSYC